MVPLTDATIVYEAAGRRRRDRAGTLILNRDATDWIQPAKEDELARLVLSSGAAEATLDVASSRA